MLKQQTDIEPFLDLSEHSISRRGLLLAGIAASCGAIDMAVAAEPINVKATRENPYTSIEKLLIKLTSESFGERQTTFQSIKELIDECPTSRASYRKLLNILDPKLQNDAEYSSRVTRLREYTLHRCVKSLFEPELLTTPKAWIGTRRNVSDVLAEWEKQTGIQIDLESLSKLESDKLRQTVISADFNKKTPWQGLIDSLNQVSLNFSIQACKENKQVIIKQKDFAVYKSSAGIFLAEFYSFVSPEAWDGLMGQYRIQSLPGFEIELGSRLSDCNQIKFYHQEDQNEISDMKYDLIFTDYGYRYFCEMSKNIFPESIMSSEVQLKFAITSHEFGLSYSVPAKIRFTDVNIGAKYAARTHSD